MRAIRARKFLYIVNPLPDRWPAGDPAAPHDPGRHFADVDDGGTKSFILDRRDEPGIERFFHWCFAKRPAEELFDVASDPFELHDLADDPAHAATKRRLRDALERWMKETADPRATNHADDRWDKVPFGGPRH